MLKRKLSENALAFITIMNNMSKREKQILILRFIKDEPMQEVADKFHIAKSRIQQIENYLIKTIDKTFEYINM